MAMNTMAQSTFCIARDDKSATIVVDEQDWKGDKFRLVPRKVILKTITNN